jgi:hypothetical protein
MQGCVPKAFVVVWEEIMSLVKATRKLAVSFGVLLALSASSAFAGCIDGPVHVDVSAGILGVFGTNDFEYTQAPTIATGGGFATVDSINIRPNMDNNGINGIFAAMVGYTNTEFGGGVNVEFTWNQIKLEGEGATVYNTFESDAWGLFLNIDYNSLGSASRNADSSLGFYASVGGGVMNFYNAEGGFRAEGVANTVATPPVPTPFVATGTFSDGSEYVAAARVKLGVGFLVADSAVFSVEASLLWTAEADNFDDVVSKVTVKDAAGAPITGFSFADNGIKLGVPSQAMAILQARFGYYFGGGM